MNKALNEIFTAENTMIKTLVIPHGNPHDFYLCTPWHSEPIPTENCSKFSLAGRNVYILYDCRSLEFVLQTTSLGHILSIFMDRPNEFALFIANEAYHSTMTRCVFEPSHVFDDESSHVFLDFHPESPSLLPLIIEEYSDLPRNF